MKDTLNRGPTINRFRNYFYFLTVFLALLIPSLVFSIQDAKAVTAAGTTISNVATADYQDTGGTAYTSNSNPVTTTVLPVYSFTITPDSSNTAGQTSTSIGTGTFTPSQSQSATAGAIIQYPYTLTNTGNSSDTYNLSIAYDSTNSTFVTIPQIKVWTSTNGVLDAGSTLVYTGTPAGNTLVSVGTTASVSTVSPLTLFVQVFVPNGVASGQLGYVNIIGTSVGDNTKVDFNNWDKTTIVNDAVVTATKSVSATTADPGAPLTYTFSLQNIGNLAAGDITITDNVPTNTTFTGITPPAGAGVTVTYYNVPLNADGTANPGVANANVITTPLSAVKSFQVFIPQAVSLAPSASTTFSFTVAINAAAPVGNIPNNGNFNYKNNANTTTTPATGTTPTNTVNTSVNRKTAIKITPNTTTFPSQTVLAAGSDIATPPALPTDQVDTNNNTVPAGTYVYFRTVLTNSGNDVDTINLTQDASIALPAGWAVDFFNETDAAVGSNNTNQIIGGTVSNLAAGASKNVVVRVFVPSNAALTAQSFRIKAASTNGGTAVGSAYPQLTLDYTLVKITNVTPPGVTLQNIANNITYTATASYTESADGTTVSFPLHLTNTGAASDTYALSSTLPTGFTVNFYALSQVAKIPAVTAIGATSVTVASATGLATGDSIVINGQKFTNITVTGTTITFSAGQSLSFATTANDIVSKVGTTALLATSAVAAGGTTDLIADVNVPASTTATNSLTATTPSYPVTFTATSAADNTKSSTVNDTVVVPAFRTFTLISNNNAQALAGGIVFYNHTLTNTGNVTETFNLSVAPGTANPAFSYQLLDTTNSPITTAITIAKGASYSFKVKVNVPAGAAANTQDTGVVTATETTATTSKSNNDITTVVQNLILSKKATVYLAGAGATGGTLCPAATCDPTASNGVSTKAQPSMVVEYTITYTNGLNPINNVVIKDTIPANTTFVAGSLLINGAAAVAPQTAVLDAVNNRVVFTLGNLAGSATGTVTFRVTVQ